MIARNLKISEGLVDGQKVVLRSIPPNSKDVSVELLTPKKRPLLPPRNVFTVQVGRNGISSHRAQFPRRVPYPLIINKNSQGQTLSRMGLDLRSDIFAHGQLYAALSRVQTRHAAMCLVSPSHV